MPNRWLFKTEPGSYSWTDLERDGKSVWDGVRNPQALRNLSQMKPGDLVFIYHTGDEKAVVGIARATSAAYRDPKGKDAKLLVIDVEPVKPLKRPVSLAEIKSDSAFSGFDLVRLPRLSVMPVSAAHAERVEKLADRSPDVVPAGRERRSTFRGRSQ